MVSVSFLIASCQTSKVSVTSGRVAQLPKPPAYITQCLYKDLGISAKSVKTRKQATRVLTFLQSDRVKRTRCGRQLHAWYAKVRVTYGK